MCLAARQHWHVQLRLTCGQLLAVGRPCDRRDLARMALQDELDDASLRVQYGHRFVERC